MLCQVFQTEGSQPPTPLLINTAIEETVPPAHHLQYLASPVVAPEGQSHWTEGAHPSKGSTPLYAASQQTFIGGRGRVLD